MGLSFNFRLAPSARQTNPDRPRASPWEVSDGIARARIGDDLRSLKIEKMRERGTLQNQSATAEPLNRHAQRQCRSIYVLFSGRAAQPTCSAAVPLNLRNVQRPIRSSALQRPSRSADMLSGNAAQSTHVSAAEPLKRHRLSATDL